MMRDSEYDDAIGLRAEDQREAEPLDDDPACIVTGRGAGPRKRKGAGCGLIHGRGEALAHAGMRINVKDDFGETHKA
jgi:hypothetical protein